MVVLHPHRPSDFTQALTDDIIRIGQGAHQVLALFSNGVNLAVYAVMALWLSPLTTAVTATCGFFVLFLMHRRPGRVQRSGRETTQTGRRLFAAIGEHLGGMKLAKSFGGEARHLKLFVRLASDAQRVSLDFIENKASTRMWFVIGSSTILCSCLYAALEVFAVPPVTLLLLVFVFGRIMPITAKTLQS